jgi:tRNA (Thr-GGU) A37 N-methylase
VLWWAHQLDGEEERSITLLPKPYKNGPEMIGVFATRSPLRPNPLALSACPVHSVDGPNGIVRLHYIDADVGSPVLDIKPYLGATDRIRNPSFPEWCSQWPSWMEDSANFDWGKVFENAR